MRWDLFFRCVFITSGFACLFLWKTKVNRKKRKKRHFKKFNRIVSFLFLETCYCRWSAQSWGWGVGVGGWIDVQKLFLRGRAALCDAFYESLCFFFNNLLPVFENRWPAFLLLPSIGRRLTLCLQPPAVDTIWSLGSLTCYFRKQIKKSGKAVMALVTSRWCGKETKAVLSTEFHNIGEVINHFKKINVVNIILHFSSFDYFFSPCLFPPAVPTYTHFCTAAAHTPSPPARLSQHISCFLLHMHLLCLSLS